MTNPRIADYGGSTQFKPGISGNPGGKPVKARNRLQGDFLRDLAEDFANHGKAAIVTMREETPHLYIKAIASLMPKELEITRPLDELDDDTLNAAILAARAILGAQDMGAGEAVSGQLAPAIEVLSLPKAE